MSKSFQAAFGRAIAAERGFQGITQAELGQRLGWSDANISAIETGVRSPTVAMLPDICAALDCSVLDLLRRANAHDRKRMGL